MIEKNIVDYVSSIAGLTITDIYNGKPQNADGLGDCYIYVLSTNESYNLPDYNLDATINIFVFSKDRAEMINQAGLIHKAFYGTNRSLGGEYYWRCTPIGLTKSADKLKSGFYWAEIAVRLSTIV